MAELRKISPEELKVILAEHKKWLDSGGKEGKQANLSGTDLRKTNLSGADLAKANLSGAKLRGATFNNTKDEFGKPNILKLRGGVL